MSRLFPGIHGRVRSPLVAVCAHVPLLLALGSGEALAGLRYEEAVARVPGQSTPLYRERHWTRYDGSRATDRLVLYLCPDGTPFARKRVDYRRSAQAPEFEFTDVRSGYREGLRRAKGPAILWFREGSASERSATANAARLVADAGFDTFIRGNWQALVAGKTLPLSFAIPARLKSLDFKLRKVEGRAVAGQPAHVFRLSLGGWLGLVAPSIDVAYGQQSQRLLRFEGLSNLRDDGGGKQLVARIDFPAADQAAGDGDWTSAETLPLKACRVRG